MQSLDGDLVIRMLIVSLLRLMNILQTSHKPLVVKRNLICLLWTLLLQSGKGGGM